MIEVGVEVGVGVIMGEGVRISVGFGVESTGLFEILNEKAPDK